MADPKLDYAVMTFDKQCLLPAGTVLSSATMYEVLSRSKASFEPISMLEYQEVKQDMLSFFQQAPYSSIFSTQERRDALIDVMAKVRLPKPVLDSLCYFKSYDYYTYRHILMIFALSTRLSEMLLPDKKEVIQEIIAGPTHDIGKLCVPLDVLRKIGALTSAERRMLDHHTAAGYVLLSYYLQDSEHLACRVARDHHERKDGSGYPKRIRLNDPSVDIIIVTDIYDALISSRPYRPISYDNRTALDVLTQMALEGKVDVETVQALVALNRAEQPHYKDCVLGRKKRGVPPADNVYGITLDEEETS